VLNPINAFQSLKTLWTERRNLALTALALSLAFSVSSYGSKPTRKSPPPSSSEKSQPACKVLESAGRIDDKRTGADASVAAKPSSADKEVKPQLIGNSGVSPEKKALELINEFWAQREDARDMRSILQRPRKYEGNLEPLVVQKFQEKILTLLSELVGSSNYVNRDFDLRVAKMRVLEQAILQLHPMNSASFAIEQQYGEVMYGIFMAGVLKSFSDLNNEILLMQVADSAPEAFTDSEFVPDNLSFIEKTIRNFKRLADEAGAESSLYRAFNSFVSHFGVQPEGADTRTDEEIELREQNNAAIPPSNDSARAKIEYPHNMIVEALVKLGFPPDTNVQDLTVLEIETKTALAYRNTLMGAFRGEKNRRLGLLVASRGILINVRTGDLMLATIGESELVKRWQTLRLFP